MPMPTQARGFTLIELMVTLAVLAILLTVAVPSFVSFRQRTALGGAAEQLVSSWNQARFEALRRDQLLKVSLVNNSGNFCFGVSETTNPADSTPCDCFEADKTQADFCGVTVFPGDSAEWNGVTAVGTPTLGGNTGVAVIDPKRGGLTDSSDWGGIALKSPEGSSDYRLNFYVDTRGRAVVCEPADAPAKIPRYADLRCSL